MNPSRRWKHELEHTIFRTTTHGVWNQNCQSVPPLLTKVQEVLSDQALRRQVVVLTETEARIRYPNLVVASLGALRKEKSGGEITTSVCVTGQTALTRISVTRRGRQLQET